MFTLAIIGYLSISFSITYLFFRYINKKSRNPKKALFSTTFCSALIFGLLCLAISGPYLDTGIKEQRDKVQEVNSTLTAENQKLKAEQSKLKREISTLHSEINSLRNPDRSISKMKKMK